MIVANYKRYVAEFLGTFTLVFCGTGAIVFNDATQSVGNTGIGITFGLVVIAMIYSIGGISGAHMNPAVTIAFWVAKKFKIKHVAPYVLSQLLGAVLASSVLWYLFPDNEFLGSTIPKIAVEKVFLIETLLTFFLMFVIMNVAHGSKEQGLMAGLAIGFTVLFEATFAGPITGASMNPARSIAPAIVSGHVDYLWIYIMAPIIGAILAVFIWKIIKIK